MRFPITDGAVPSEEPRTVTERITPPTVRKRRYEQVPFGARGEDSHYLSECNSARRAGNAGSPKGNLPGCLTLVRKKTTTECLRRALAPCGRSEHSEHGITLVLER